MAADGRPECKRHEQLAEPYPVFGLGRVSCRVDVRQALLEASKAEPVPVVCDVDQELVDQEDGVRIGRQLECTLGIYKVKNFGLKNKLTIKLRG